mmetsp:Transcript_21121/g.58924  ORF Transcript_21121/g.58924 Transcript_21121/m.58924 type:complete len:245 (-) Transcript_21121:584-1318(-)
MSLGRSFSVQPSPSQAPSAKSQAKSLRDSASRALNEEVAEAAEATNSTNTERIVSSNAAASLGRCPTLPPTPAEAAASMEARSVAAASKMSSSTGRLPAAAPSLGRDSWALKNWMSGRLSAPKSRQTRASAAMWRASEGRPASRAMTMKRRANLFSNGRKASSNRSGCRGASRLIAKHACATPTSSNSPTTPSEFSRLVNMRTRSGAGASTEANACNTLTTCRAPNSSNLRVHRAARWRNNVAS